MREPDRRVPAEAPERAPRSPEERRRVIKAAFLRPMNVVVPVIGLGIFATTLLWWVPPLTVVTYAALVFLSIRDPAFGEQALQGREARPSPRDPGVSPERRARWLPRGETRQKVEAALSVHRKILTAIEESDDVTRAVLDGAIPKLHAVAERLVDVAHRRERAAGALDDLRSHATTSTPKQDEDLARLDSQFRAADAEISGMVDSLLTLRARVVRISIESEVNAQAAAGDLNDSLDELNIRLEALSATLSPRDNP